MKKNKKISIILLLITVLLLTGCTQTLTSKDKKPVKNETTGQTLTKNIICKPTNKETINIYKENKVDLSKLPDCNKFKITSGKYEGLWTTIFVKPLAFVLLKVGKFVHNYGISVILISLIIRLIA